MNIKNLIVSVVSVATTISRELNDNEEIKALLCGEYSDGRTRSISDAIAGEYRSPKQRRKESGNKKKHKKDKYKKKYKNLKKKTKKHNKKQKKYAKKYKYTIWHPII